MNISDWFNKTSMTSFRSFVLVIVFTLVVIYFSIVAGILLLDNNSAAAALNSDAAIRAAAQATESSHHSFGMQVINSILQLLALAIGVNAASVFGDRITAREHVEAKERGKVAGAAIAASMGLTNGTTKEHPTADSAKVQINTRVQEGPDNGQG